MMKSRNLTFGLAQCSRGGKGLARRFAVHFTSQTIVGTIAAFARFMAATAGFSTAATDGRDRSAAEIVHFKNLAQNDGSSPFEIDKSLRQVAPPFLTHQYVRNSSTKKRTRIVSTFLSCTRPNYPGEWPQPDLIC